MAVRMQRTWWEYAKTVALNHKLDKAFKAIRDALKEPGKLTDVVTVNDPGEFGRLLKAIKATKGRERTAAAFEAAQRTTSE